jgi:hypothetical protein
LQFWQGANVFNGLSPKNCHFSHFVAFPDSRWLVPQRGLHARSEPHRCAGAAQDKRGLQPLSLVRAVSKAQPGEWDAGIGCWRAISFRVSRFFKGLRRHLLPGVRAQPPRRRRLVPSGGPLGAGALQFWQGANVFKGLSPRNCHFVAFPDRRSSAAGSAETAFSRVMPADAGIQKQPLRLKRLSGGFWTPAFARVTREGRNGREILGRRCNLIKELQEVFRALAPASVRLAPRQSRPHARFDPHRCAGRRLQPLSLVRAVSEVQPGGWDAGIG